MRSCLVLALVLGFAIPPGLVQADDRMTLAEEEDEEACIASFDDATAARWATRVDALTHRASRRTRGWFFSWIAVNAGFVLGASLWAVGFRHDPLQRDAGIWGAAGSGATLALLFAPPPSMAFAERRLARLPESERDDPRLRMIRSLAELHRGEHMEPTMRFWALHVVNSAFSISEALYLGLRYDNSLGTALGNFFATLTISETQLLTAPRASEKAIGELRREGMPCLSHEVVMTPVRPRATVMPLLGGLRVEF